MPTDDHADLLQAMEHLADEIDLAEMLNEVVTLRRAGSPISAATVDRYAAELERLEGERAKLRETITAILGADWKDGRAVIQDLDGVWSVSSSARDATVD